MEDNQTPGRCRWCGQINEPNASACRCGEIFWRVRSGRRPMPRMTEEQVTQFFAEAAEMDAARLEIVLSPSDVVALAMIRDMEAS